mmetsp:Transcript_24428/g.39375  ORF Transcript_24428/g.39375 Transcript_24428/m.39375 type:complete len:219 (+) Transcript_24428:709-1365(+)
MSDLRQLRVRMFLLVRFRLFQQRLHAIDIELLQCTRQPLIKRRILRIKRVRIAKHFVMHIANILRFIHTNRQQVHILLDESVEQVAIDVFHFRFQFLRRSHQAMIFIAQLFLAIGTAMLQLTQLQIDPIIIHSVHGIIQHGSKLLAKRVIVMNINEIVRRNNLFIARHLWHGLQNGRIDHRAHRIPQLIIVTRQQCLLQCHSQMQDMTRSLQRNLAIF